MVLLGNHKDKVVDRLRKKLGKGSVKCFDAGLLRVSVLVCFKKEDKTPEPVFRGHCQIALKPDEIESAWVLKLCTENLQVLYRIPERR